MLSDPVPDLHGNAVYMRFCCVCSCADVLLKCVQHMTIAYLASWYDLYWCVLQCWPAGEASAAVLNQLGRLGFRDDVDRFYHSHRQWLECLSMQSHAEIEHEMFTWRWLDDSLLPVSRNFMHLKRMGSHICCALQCSAHIITLARSNSYKPQSHAKLHRAEYCNQVLL